VGLHIEAHKVARAAGVQASSFSPPSSSQQLDAEEEAGKRFVDQATDEELDQVEDEIRRKYRQLPGSQGLLAYLEKEDIQEDRCWWKAIARHMKLRLPPSTTTTAA
jgi:hypothetical protein